MHDIMVARLTAQIIDQVAYGFSGLIFGLLIGYCIGLMKKEPEM